ncbi:MAG: hypothetical protein WBS20_08655, partial [Lysobacterales bacterium]
VLATTLMIGCERKGPAEQAGEKIDQAYEDIQDSGKDLGNEIEDACEHLKKEAGAEDKDC